MVDVLGIECVRFAGVKVAHPSKDRQHIEAMYSLASQDHDSEEAGEFS